MLRRTTKFPPSIGRITLFIPTIIPSNNNNNLRHISSGVTSHYEQHRDTVINKTQIKIEEGYDIGQREKGRVYHRRQPLWPSLTALEKDMTKASFAPAERLPPELLPADVAALQLEGSIPDDVFEEDFDYDEKMKKSAAASSIHQEQRDELQLQQMKQMDVSSSSSSKPFAEVEDLLQGEDEDPTASLLNDDEKDSNTKTKQEGQSSASVDDFDMDDLAAMAFASSSSSSEQQQQTKPQKEKQLASSSSNRKSTILADLSSNDVSNPIASWSACGLDPVVENRAMQVIGRGASRAQSRLLPALLNDDHNDVIFGSVTGSGKTVALLLAMLQGVRNETSGLNIFVCADALNCQRAVDFLKKFDEGGLLDMADTRTDQDAGGMIPDDARIDKYGQHNMLKDWLIIADRRENYETYFLELVGSLDPKRPQKRMMVCTADVLAELLFERKMEFGPFGNLRRLYMDDISKDVRFAPKTATPEQKQLELRDPSASQLVLATIHQLMDPQSRSLLQIAAIAADMESDLSRHLLSLCIKPTRHTLIACASRLPTTLHCVFSFYAQHTNDKYEYLTTLLRNASPAIPGRVLIFFPSDVDLLETRASLMREAGLDAKLLFEVKTDYFANKTEQQEDSNNNNSSWSSGWRYLLLHEHEGFGLDIPYVSHVVLTFCPSNRFSLLHICGRAARAGNPGWVFTIVPRSEAQNVSNLCKELDVDVRKTTIDVNLQNVPEDVVDRWVRPPTPWTLDPQKVVEHRYLKMEDAIHGQTSRGNTMFNQSPGRKGTDFQMEDYTPVEVLNRRFRQSLQLRRDLQNMPELAVEMAREGLLNPNNLKPTKKLIEMFDRNESLPIQSKSGYRYSREQSKMEWQREHGSSVAPRLFNK